MKKSIVTILLSGLVLLSCSKDETSDQQPDNQNPSNVSLSVENSPSAKAADDNKSSGVYKGTFVGSSGSFKLVLENDSILGILELDGQGYLLTTASISSSDLGGKITNALFTDATGTVSLTFSVNEDGSNPQASVTIVGHNQIRVTVKKERSFSHVRSYEGKFYYTYDDSSEVYQCVFNGNILISGDTGTADVPYKYLSSNILVGNTSDCDVSDAGVLDGYFYSIIGNNINMYQWARECDTCPMFKEGFLDLNENGSINSSEITFFSETYVGASGRTNQDSARFIRKL